MLVIGAMAAFACAGGAPTSPAMSPDITGQMATPANHMAWGVFDLAYDVQTGKAEVIWNRQAAAHLNVTSKVKAPACNDCVVIADTTYNPATSRFTVQLNFKNPTTFTGYDVRGVISNNGGNKFLLNPDGVTQVWGPPMAFKALDVDAERTFGALETHGRQFEFYFPAGENFKTLTYIIDASYPGYVTEPMAENGTSDPLVNNNFATTFIRIWAFDHQSDLAAVIADLMPLGGSPMTQMYDDGTHNDGAAGDHVFGVTGIKTSVAEGIYMINVYPSDSGGHMGWGQVALAVTKTSGGPNDPPVVQNITSDRTTANGNANEKIKITVTAVDPNGDDLNYKFSGTGTFSGQNGGVVYWKPSGSSLGAQTINISVEDDKGGKTPGSIKLWSTNLAVKNGSTSGMIPSGTVQSMVPSKSLKMATDFQGQVLYINFFATWCGPCMAEMPELSTMYNKLKSNSDYNQCMIDLQEPESTVQPWLTQTGYKATYWCLDLSGSYFGACLPFNGSVNAIPQHLLFDRDGRCRWGQVGSMSGTTELEGYINQLL
jgi:hypothetical protein